VRQLVYGTIEPKFGALVSACRALELPAFNHRFAVLGGVREQQCRDLVQQFFREKRAAPARGRA
jgi:tRNA(adenine34) deaminase